MLAAPNLGGTVHDRSVSVWTEAKNQMKRLYFTKYLLLLS